MLLIFRESMSQSLYCRLVSLRQHRDYDMDSGNMSNTANPVLSPYLFIQSLYASLKFVGFFYLLSPLNCIHRMRTESVGLFRLALLLLAALMLSITKC